MLADISAFIEDNIVVAIPIVLGAIFSTIGVSNLRRVTYLRSRGIRVPGRITGSRGRFSRGSSGTTTAKFFEFTTLDGRAVRTRQPLSTSPNLLRSGREVTVAYDERDPERAEVIEAMSQVTASVLFTLIGVVCLVVAVVIVLVRLG